MVHLYLIRHGETEANKAFANKQSFVNPTNEGGLPTNVPLTELGIEQSRSAAHELPNNIDAFFSSSLMRVQQTAQVICAEKGIDPATIVIRDALKEYEKGTVEGLSFDEISKVLGRDMWEDARNCSYDYTSVGGDSWQVIHDRAQSFLNELKQNYDGKTVVCATSGGFIRMFYKIVFKDINPTISRHLAIRNASVHEFFL